MAVLDLMVQGNGNLTAAKREDTVFRIAIAATFTAEPLRRTISFWSGRLGMPFETVFAPYNQVLQTLLGADREFATNPHGANVVLVRLEDLVQFDAADPEYSPRLRQNVEQLATALRVPHFHVPTVLVVCPPSVGFAADPRRLELATGLTGLLQQELSGVPSVHMLDIDTIDTWYPVDAQHDAEGDRLGKIPYTESYYCAIGTAIVRFVHALTRAPFKLIALDCDNTLWEGICGEDGPENVNLDPARRTLHEFMLGQREKGMLLALNSKNNESDVEETFRLHPEFPLQLEHFVARRLNWESKAENLLSISRQLSLGVDSFLFIDDSPKECAELAGALPEVVTLPLPLHLDSTAHFLQHVWAFDHPVVTAEDLRRSERYRQVAEYQDHVQRAGSLESFLSSLDLQVRIRPMEAVQVARVAQLTQRTNQFNLTTVRRNEGQIAALENADIYVAEVSDRFGDYGLTGVAIAQRQDSDYILDTFLLSCRVLGRGVEHRFIAELAQRAASAGCDWLVLRYRETEKNRPARLFVESVNSAQRTAMDGGFDLRLPVAQARGLEWKPSTGDGTSSKKSQGVPKTATSRGLDYAAIANDLATVPQILATMRSSGSIAGSQSASMTSVERELALIWSELLDKPSVLRTDNFFDLGGHSLLAVLLLLRIRETFGIELSIDDVYSGTLTLADLAAHIEAAQLGDIDPEEYAALLAEIESMSDEEARMFLSRETGQD
jgi:FkbH-like protein